MEKSEPDLEDLTLEVFEDSIGFFIGCQYRTMIFKRSLYYESEDQAKSELEDNSWRKRIGG